ncbi:MAG TPA: hypothetical protein VFH15_04710 [Pyrinomonadaceae bacterium]|nr:hypothetical protein [Pyrinomonadaceae bacterium]
MTNESNQQRSESRQQSVPDVPLNYFSYFTEVEDAFIRRRGKHLHLSPFDWELIETWKDLGVPLHIVLRGIEQSFDSWEAKPRKRTVKSLLYCQEEIEAQYAEWLDSRVGATPEEAKDAVLNEDEGLPFPRQAVLDHLQRGQQALEQAGARRASEDDLTEAISRVVGLLAEVQKDFATAARPDARQLEVSLTGLERTLSDALLRVVSQEETAGAQNEVKEQLRPYRSHMDKAAYEQTFNNLLLKRLREDAGLPRLSLFYL